MKKSTKYSAGAKESAELAAKLGRELAALPKRGMDYALRLSAQLREEIEMVRQHDPAARGSAEILLLYSGLHAVLCYRLAHIFYLHGHRFTARLISQTARFLTGIEIHPGAKIGRCLFIDHGSGVVIGETAEIGDYCTLYQGVTLGGTGKHQGKRHPTLGNHVMVGAGAKVLGPFRIGDRSKIAAGAVVLDEIPADSTAVGIPARVVRRCNRKVAPDDNMDQVHIPDPVAQEICRLQVQIERLEAQIQKWSEKAEDSAAQSGESAQKGKTTE